MQQRLLALGLVKKPVTEREKRRIVCEKRADEIARLMSGCDRGALYEQVWSQPVLVVAREYRISGVTDWGLRGALFARVLGPSHSSALRCPAEIH